LHALSFIQRGQHRTAAAGNQSAAVIQIDPAARKDDYA
jgi:hypothetical protein